MGSLNNEKGFESKMELKEFVLKSLDGMIELINTLNHPKRLQILATLINGDVMTFSDLIEASNLQKSALSNHLTRIL